MKILIIISSLSAGGAERFCSNIANHWDSRGYAVAVVTIHGSSEDFYPLNHGVKRISLGLGKGSANLAQALLNNWRRVRALRVILREEQADIALSLLDQNNVLLALASIGLSGPIVIGSERIHPEQSPIPRLWGMLRRWTYGQLDAVVVLAQETAKWVAENTNAKRVEVIQNPVVWPMENLPPAVSPPPKHGCRLLAAGRLHDQKQFHLLIEAFCQLAPVFPAWELVIIGDGPERGSLLERMRSSGLAERMQLPGRVGNIGDWYRTADLFVMTSRYEGFPNTLVEAMAHGLPAVSFDCDAGPRDIIRHGIDGLLVPSGNLTALIAALRTLMRDEAQRASFAHHAAEVRERFSMEQAMEKWQALFTSLEGP